MKKVGIFGGSFNPIHTGHIALAKSLCEKAGLDEVWFMVSPMNPFKKAATDLLDDHLRLEMVEKALEKLPEIPDLVLNGDLLNEEGIFVFEHGKNYDFSDHPRFLEHRSYGSVNFSIFR